jgi:hypothetical protein
MNDHCIHCVPQTASSETGVPSHAPKPAFWLTTTHPEIDAAPTFWWGGSVWPRSRRGGAEAGSEPVQVPQILQKQAGKRRSPVQSTSRHRGSRPVEVVVAPCSAGIRGGAGPPGVGNNPRDPGWRRPGIAWVPPERRVWRAPGRRWASFSHLTPGPATATIQSVMAFERSAGGTDAKRAGPASLLSGPAGSRERWQDQ